MHRKCRVSSHLQELSFSAVRNAPDQALAAVAGRGSVVEKIADVFR
jgi:hypothetical protein